MQPVTIFSFYTSTYFISQTCPYYIANFPQLFIYQLEEQFQQHKYPKINRFKRSSKPYFLFSPIIGLGPKRAMVDLSLLAPSHCRRLNLPSPPLLLLLMITPKLIFLLALLFATAFTQVSPVMQALVANNTALQITLDNYFGCAQWNGTSCQQCSQNYYFNVNGICCQVSPQCQLFNQDVGICQQCYTGYGLYNGTCQVIPPNQQINPACLNWVNSTCTKCSIRFYNNSQGTCVPVSDYCRTWNQDGACLTCYGGYLLNNQSQCILDPQPFTPASNSLCSNWNGDICLACSLRAYFDVNGVCQPVSNYCNTWDPQTGKCYTCYPGFVLLLGQCQLAPTITPADIGCKIWNWTTQVCLACSQNWVFNLNSVCIPVSDYCQTSNAQGQCLTCYQGYDLTAGACILSPSNNVGPTDLGCQIWDWNNNKCLECSNWYFFGVNGVCQAVSSLCQTYLNTTGACASCFAGYSLTLGICSQTNPAPIPDLGCQSWNWTAKVCLACSKNWVFINNVCVPVSDQCLTWNNTNGNCLSCYKGYNLQNGACIIQNLSLINPPDKGCYDWNWDALICLSCSQRWYLNSAGVCAPVSDLCKTNDPNGNCLTCYIGYNLVKGACQLTPIATPSDAGCKTWDWNNQVCLACSNGYTFNSNNVCTAVSNQCKTYDSASGLCLTCFKGYDLINGACVFAASNNAHPSDLGCAKWDWDNQVCLSCSKNWVFNSQGVCTPVSDQCFTSDASGGCTSCFKGYDLVKGVCVFSPSNNAQPADLGCATWDWNNQLCLACSKGYTFNSNKVCTPVSSQCSSYDNVTGLCLSCFKGYDLINGTCAFSASNTAHPSDLGCGNWDWNNQICLSCSKGYVFNSNKVCAPVSDQCSAYNNTNGQCLSCFKGYDLINGNCVFATSNNAKPLDSGCANWDWNNQVCLACSNGYTFNSNKICTAVSNQCKTYDSASGLCLTCFKGYDLINGACVFAASNNAHPSDLGCAKWDWDNQVCLSCSKNWVFNSQGVCTPVSDQCSTSDASGACTSCFKGYDLVKGVCVFSPSNNAQPADLGCATWDWNNQLCLACSKGYTFNSNKVCTPVSSQCNSYDNVTGLCLACFKGYDLTNGNCVFSASNTAKPLDLGCANWDWNNQVCLACSNGYTFNNNKVCTTVSNQCKTYDSASGLCLTCFKGYDLINGACVFAASNNAHPSDLGCAKWDWDNQVCLSCSKNWVFNSQGVCTPVSDQCSTSDASGACTSCFKGYDLVKGVCVFSPSNNVQSADLGCATWDWNNQLCLACSKGYTFNSNKVCTPVSSQCSSYDNVTGLCLSCFKGYDLINGTCAFSASNTAHPSDLGCGNWDWNNQICLSCSKGYVFNSNKVCAPVSDQCSAYNNTNGQCLSCFKGYDLINGNCVFSASNNAKPSDSECANWDWNNQICLSCSSGYVFNSQKICTPVSDQCKAYNSNGLCTSCFIGYDLINGTCAFSSFNSAKPSDSGCAEWNWDNQVCLKCSNRWVFNSNKQCVPVSDYCSSYDSSSGKCTGCFAGYVLSNGQCNLGNPFCKSTGPSGNCLTCYTGYVAVSNNCVPISSLASLYMYYAACCPQKLAELQNGTSTATP